MTGRTCLTAACLCALLCLGSLLHGCSSQKDPYEIPKPLPATSPEKVAWSAEPGAITIIVDAESDSNLIDNVGHATSLCIMQLPKDDVVKAQAATEEGLRELLQCRPKPPDILSATRLYVQPGEFRVFPMDRVEGAKHMAVAAGFNTLSPETSFASVPMPLHEEKVRSVFLVTSHMEYSPAPMKLGIRVGQATVSVQGVERED